MSSCWLHPSSSLNFTAVYEKALTIKPLLSDVEQLIPVVLGRAGFEKRTIEAGKTGRHYLCPLAHVRLRLKCLRVTNKASITYYRL